MCGGGPCPTHCGKSSEGYHQDDIRVLEPVHRLTLTADFFHQSEDNHCRRGHPRREPVFPAHALHTKRPSRPAQLSVTFLVESQDERKDLPVETEVSACEIVRGGLFSRDPLFKKKSQRYVPVRISFSTVG